ncbi:MAG: DUF3658 domain-containing protein [Oscillospiraceae bacterium]
MIELCFGDSIKGSLRCAQHCGGSTAGAIGLIRAGKLSWIHWLQRKKALAAARAEQAALEKQAISLGGRREDVLSVSFDFSLGDIAEPLAVDDCARKRLLSKQFTADPWGELKEIQSEFEKFWQCCFADLNSLKAHIASGDDIRIWLDTTPSSCCGLLFVANLLEGSDVSVTVMKMPSKCTRPDGVTVTYRGWGEVAPELLGSFLDIAVALSSGEIAALSAQWKKLQGENAPMRAVKDGAVISVGADYYDDIIRAAYPPASCSVAKLIGDVLNCNIGIGDALIAERIRFLLAAGELKTLKNDPSRFYNSVICRAK